MMDKKRTSLSLSSLSVSSKKQDVQSVELKHMYLTSTGEEYIKIRFQKFDDDGTVTFDIKHSKELVICFLDSEAILCNTKFWKANESLLKGQTGILVKALYKYLKEDSKPKRKWYILMKNNVRATDETGLMHKINFELIKEDKDERLFEEILLKVAQPLLQDNILNKSTLIMLERNGCVHLAVEDSFISAINKLLKDPNLFQDQITKYAFMTYEYFYRELGEKDFIAPLDRNNDQYYRVRVLERADSNPTLVSLGFETKMFKVLYMDIGIEKIVDLKDFVCMTKTTRLPPLLRKLPPQVVKCQLSGFRVGVSEHIDVFGNHKDTPVMARVIAKLNKETEAQYSVILYRTSDIGPDQDDVTNVVSFNRHLCTVELKNYRSNLETNGLSCEVARDKTRDMWLKFQRLDAGSTKYGDPKYSSQHHSHSSFVGNR